MVLRFLRWCWRSLPIPSSLREWVDRFYLYPKLPCLTGPRDGNSGPLTILGYFHSGLGIGEAARQQVLALRHAGISHAWMDVSHVQGIRDLEDQRFTGVPAFPGTGPILVHVNASETGRILKYFPPRNLTRRPIIGFWAWELNRPPLDWWRAFQYLDELWVPSEFVAEVFRPASPVPVRTVPIPVQRPPTEGLGRIDFGIPEGTCLFLCMADGRSDLARKNISGSIRAFKMAHGDNPKAVLVVKLHHADFYMAEFRSLQGEMQGARNIRLLTQFLSSPAIGDLIRVSDIFVSLHRAEGFSLPLAQAMLLGKPVIATAYSGNMTFMNQRVARLIDYSLVPVRSSRRVYARIPGAVWADANLDQAASAMKELASIPALRTELGRAGREFAEGILAPERFLEALSPWVEHSGE